MKLIKTELDVVNVECGECEKIIPLFRGGSVVHEIKGIHARCERCCSELKANEEMVREGVLTPGRAALIPVWNRKSKKRVCCHEEEACM